MSRLTRDGTAKLSRETKLSGANGEKEFFSVQLTMNRIGKLPVYLYSALCYDDVMMIGLESPVLRNDLGVEPGFVEPPFLHSFVR